MSIKSNPEVASPAARVAGIERVLNERELLPEGVLDSLENSVEEDLDWHNGARIVARAWTDPDYRRRLLEEGTAACAELGFAGPQGEYIVALEATKDLHHVIVCTQCSCTAWPRCARALGAYDHVMKILRRFKGDDVFTLRSGETELRTRGGPFFEKPPSVVRIGPRTSHNPRSVMPVEIFLNRIFERIQNAFGQEFAFVEHALDSRDPRGGRGDFRV